MQCEHSPKTWQATEEFWTWCCPVCGLVDGFTGEIMQGQLEILHGLWAIRWEGGRVDYTRFPPGVKAERVLKAVRAEFKGFVIAGPAEPGWLFDDLWEVTPLFGGNEKC